MSWRIREAHAFADALSGARTSAGGDMAFLVAVAQHLRRTAAELRPLPAFQAALRTSLLAEAAVILTAGVSPVMAPADRWTVTTDVSRRRAAILAAALATTLGLAGMTASSASALPGDTLYPVKRGIENAELALRRGDSAQGSFRLELASERLHETNDLTERPSVASSLEADTLSDYSDEADRGSGALVRSFKHTHRRGDIVTLNHFANDAAGALTHLEGKLDGPAATVLHSAQAQLASIVETASGLCPNCGGIDPDVADSLAGTGPDVAAEPPARDETAPDLAAPAPVGKSIPPASSGDGKSAADENDTKDQKKDSDSSDSDTQDRVASILSPVPPLTPPLNLPTLPTPPLPTPTSSTTPTPAPTLPTADFTWSGSPGVGNALRVDFDDASSSDAITWKWDFGDGSTTSTAQNPPRHTYPAAGTYSVTLTVANAGGGTQSVTKVVTVPVGPSPLKECAPTVDQQLVKGLLNCFSHLVGDVE